jgi:hypothetical protein
MTLDGPVIVALAALAGSLVGAFSSVVATFIGQRLQARWTQLRAELEERRTLYDFSSRMLYIYSSTRFRDRRSTPLRSCGCIQR